MKITSANIASSGTGGVTPSSRSSRPESNSSRPKAGGTEESTPKRGVVVNLSAQAKRDHATRKALKALDASQSKPQAKANRDGAKQLAEKSATTTRKMMESVKQEQQQKQREAAKAVDELNRAESLQQNAANVRAKEGERQVTQGSKQGVPTFVFRAGPSGRQYLSDVKVVDGPRIAPEHTQQRAGAKINKLV